MSKAYYVFTTDTDWCTEHALRQMLDIFSGDVPLHVFATGEYECLSDYPPEDIGIHPNFMSDSTQGDSPEEIVDYLQELYPEAISFRCHRYYSDSLVMEELKRRGFLYSANFCTLYQANIKPLMHYTGIVEFPTYYEDDMSDVDFISFWKNMNKGVHIFNFHPSKVVVDLDQQFIMRTLIKDYGDKAVSLNDLYGRYSKQVDIHT